MPGDGVTGPTKKLEWMWTLVNVNINVPQTFRLVMYTCARRRYNAIATFLFQD